MLRSYKNECLPPNCGRLQIAPICHTASKRNASAPLSTPATKLRLTQVSTLVPVRKATSSSLILYKAEQCDQT
jgi:hypothetical protein